MSSLEEMIPIAEEAFDALERGDADRFTELTGPLTHPECEFHSGIGSMVGGATYKGAEGIHDWFADLISTTSERRWRNRRWETHGEDFLVFFADLEFTGASSGAPVASETASVYEWKNGLCIQINSFTSFDEARRFLEARVA